jgi:hypothetical protein
LFAGRPTIVVGEGLFTTIVTPVLGAALPAASNATLCNV